MRSRKIGKKNEWEEYYAITVSFPEVSFDKYMQKSDACPETFHVHLLPRKNEIELRIFFDPKTLFDYKLSWWIKEIDLRKFGSFLKLSDENKNDNLLRVDLSDASLVGMSTSTNFYNGKLQFTRLFLDVARFYWKPEKDHQFTGNFFLTDDGFKIVSEFYATLFGRDGKYEISRMNDSHLFYPIGKSEFRPEFDFGFNDGKDKRKATITKAPKIHFIYHHEIAEEESFLLADAVRLILSFFLHFDVHYKLLSVRLPENKITIKKVYADRIVPSFGNLWGFNLYWNLNKFFQSDWQQGAIVNYKILQRVITLFNQSHVVDSNSKFLIRFNLLEIFTNSKSRYNSKFKVILRTRERKMKYDQALKLLLSTVDSFDAEAFTKKWNGVKGQLAFKPIEGRMISFLKGENLPVKDFPITVGRLIQIRNNLVHGSIDSIDEDELVKANQLLYRISGILILNLIGIKDWKFKMDG